MVFYNNLLMSLLCYFSILLLIEPLRSLLGRRGGLPIDYDKRTPLHVAASSGHEEVVRFLIYYGFPINPLDMFVFFFFFLFSFFLFSHHITK